MSGIRLGAITLIRVTIGIDIAEQSGRTRQSHLGVANGSENISQNAQAITDRVDLVAHQDPAQRGEHGTCAPNRDTHGVNTVRLVGPSRGIRSHQGIDVPGQNGEARLQCSTRPQVGGRRRMSAVASSSRGASHLRRTGRHGCSGSEYRSLDGIQRSGVIGSTVDDLHLPLTPEAQDANIGSAFAAVNAMAARTNDLDDWVQSVDVDARDIRLGLGIFADQANAIALAEQFAILGAVDEEQVTVNGRVATRLTLTHLKPGVARVDALDLARQLGLTDIILY